MPFEGRQLQTGFQILLIESSYTVVTKCMEQSRFWEANGHSISEESLPSLYETHRFICRIDKNLPLAPILG
jgi:hypothetical protein